jgi:branched-chain amino acid transport system substrate-binding protein
MLGKRGLFVFAFIVALFVVLAAPGSYAARSAAKTPYVIGAIFSVTGDNAPLGVPERDTAQMLAKQLNAAGGIGGHPVKLMVYDDTGKPEQAVRACQDLLANKDVVAIIGPTLTGPSLAIATMCNGAKMPLISCAASVKIVQPVKAYVFKTAQTDSLAVAKLIDYLKKSRIRTVGFINDSNAFGASGREQWQKLSGPAGIKTVDVESFNSADTDMTAQLTKIRAARPQAVICWGTNPGPAIVAKNMRTLGMKQPLLMSHGISNMEFIRLAGRAAEGVVFPSGKIIVASQIPAGDPQKKVLLGYSAQYQKAYGKPASHFGGHAWDAFQLVVDAVKKVGPNHARIRDNIEGRKNFVGIDGVFNLSRTDHNGLNKNAFALVTIKNGKWVLIK